MNQLKVIFFLLQFNIFYSFSQQAVFVPVPQPPAGGTYVGTQDQKGYMWFGGNGLHRYDGYSYKSYFNDLDDPSLVFGKVESIMADRKGFIWFSVWGKGLLRLDPETGIFKQYRNKPSNTNSISNDIVSVILQASDGKIWVGTEFSGLNCIDPETGKITRFQSNESDSTTLSCDKVTALFEDSEKTIWVGTGYLWSAGSVANKNKGGLNRFNRANKSFTRFLHKPEDSTSLIDNRVRTIFEDRKGRFWVGTAGDGLHLMNRETGSFERYQYKAADPHRLSRPPIGQSSEFADDMITFIREDGTGNFWVGTLYGGLNRFDPETGMTTYYASLKEKSSDKAEVSNFVWCDTTKDGVLWVGSWNDGIYRMDPLHKQITIYGDLISTISLIRDNSGKLWLGTLRNGVIVYDSSGKEWRRFINNISDPNSLSSNQVNSIFEDNNGKIWIGTDKGLDCYDRQSQKLTRSLIRNNISVIYEDGQGSFWLGTEKGLALMNRKDGSITFPLKTATGNFGLSQGNISSIREDWLKILWIGQSEWKGLTRYDKKSGKTKLYLPQSSIQSIFEASDSTLWIGTKRGLYFFNPTLNSFELYTNTGAGLTENIFVYHILQDDQQHLWLNTSMGLVRLDNKRKEIIFFGNRDVNNPSLYAALQGGCYKKGSELFFVNNKGSGYHAFYPGRLKRNKIAPQVNVTAFRLGDQIVSPGNGSSLSAPLSQTSEIHLAHNNNTFSFDFVGIHYSSPEGNRHRYKLEKYDKDWRIAGEEKTAYYYKVPPGDYIFRVQASNSDGVWADEKSIVVTISPPFWETWTFRLLSLVALIIVGYAIIKERSRKLKAENIRLEEKVAHRTAQLNKSLEDLKATQSQLIQSEKMASLGELTAGIAHEIQNPLNFVNNFSEVNAELLQELQDGPLKNLSETDKQQVDIIINDLNQNLEKINQHGKRADSIVKGMLQHSKASTGHKELTDINALADEFLRLSYHGMRAKDKTFNAALQTDFDKGLDKILIIPQDIGRVLLNLYNNAFYAIGERFKVKGLGYEPAVSISTKKNGDRIEIRVADNGSGIPQTIKDKIFQPFFTTKPTGQGTGLGLSLSYDIVKAHGGEISVNSKEGEGAEFIIQLPVA